MKKILLMLLALAMMVTVFALTSCGHDCSYTVEVVESSTAATCLKSGVKVLKCSECENTKNEIIPALGHDYISNVIEPTCKTEGYTTQTCSRCGDTNGDAKLDKKQPTGKHTYVVVEGSKVEATCTTNGYEIEKCSTCNAERKTNVVTAPGHDYVEKEIYVGGVAPTCTTGAEGVTTRRCSVCDEKDETFKDVSKTYPALGHDIPHDDAHRINTVAATCTTARHDTWKCSRCTKTEDADVGTALGHDCTVDTNEIIKPATCYSLEERNFKCVRYGQEGCRGTPNQGEPIQTKIIENSYASHTMGSAATCVDAQICTVCQAAPGRTALSTNCDMTNDKCQNCSQSGKIHVFANPTGLHNYKDYTNGTFVEAQRIGDPVAPTCMRQGYSVYDCTVPNCTETFKDNYTDIDLTAHNVDFDTALGDEVASTCTKYSFTYHKCTNTSEDGTTTCEYVTEKSTSTTFADHQFADGEPTGVITCTKCQTSFYDTTYVESVYKEYVKVEEGKTGEYKKVEEYIAAEGGNYILDEGTSQYRPIVDGEVGTHKLVVRFEEATGEDANYVLKTWDGKDDTKFDTNTNLNVKITVSKSNADPLKLDSTKTFDDTITDETGITIIRIVSSDDTTKYKVTVNGTQTYEVTGNGYIDLHDYLDGVDPKDASDDVAIESLKVEIVEGAGEATVYFYGKEAVPAE